MYLQSGNAVIRVTDPDEDLDDTTIDQITIDVYSDSDSGGVQTTLSETDEGYRCIRRYNQFHIRRNFIR